MKLTYIRLAIRRLISPKFRPSVIKLMLRYVHVFFDLFSNKGESNNFLLY